MDAAGLPARTGDVGLRRPDPVSVLAIVGGPVTSIRQDTSPRRDRDELIVLLASLALDTGP